MSNKYIIDESLLTSLIESSNRLEALECGGVDNWEFYGESIHEWREENQVEDMDEAAENKLTEWVKDNTIQLVAAYKPTDFEINLHQAEDDNVAVLKFPVDLIGIDEVSEMFTNLKKAYPDVTWIAIPKICDLDFYQKSVAIKLLEDAINYLKNT